MADDTHRGEKFKLRISYFWGESFTEKKVQFYFSYGYSIKETRRKKIAETVFHIIKGGKSLKIFVNFGGGKGV